VAVLKAEKLLAERKTFTLGEFKYALESCWQTPAIARCASAQLFNCNARRRFQVRFSKENVFLFNPESSRSKNVKLQEFAVMAINFVGARSYGATPP
jgi:hypothetical protein